MTSIKYMSSIHKKPYWYNSETKESVWDESNDNDKWTRYISKKQHLTEKHGIEAKCDRYYWYNSKTHETIWEISKKEKPIISKKIIISKKTIIAKKPIIAKKSTYNNDYHSNDEYKEYNIYNNNGISTTISATDKYDAMEKMRDIAQSLNPHD
jgi:hypothetical protein